MRIVFAMITFLTENRMCNFRDFVNQIDNEMIKNKKVFRRKKTRIMLDKNMKWEVKEWKFISLSLTLEREIYQDPKLHFCNNISGYFKLTTSFELINRRRVIKEKIGFWLDRMLNYLRYIHHILFNWTFTIS